MIRAERNQANIFFLPYFFTFCGILNKLSLLSTYLISSSPTHCSCANPSKSFNMNYRSALLQESLKGEIHKLKSDLENTEKRAQETKASLMAQSGSMEGEFKQTVANLKKKNEDNISKMNEERVRLQSFRGKKIISSKLVRLTIFLCIHNIFCRSKFGATWKKNYCL